MEVEACYNYGLGLLPAARHQPPYPPHPSVSEDGELWEYFPCPFCYIEVEVPFICNHLQEEHCFDTKNAVCPICANNLGRDMSAHFRVQHTHLLKRRKPSKPSSWHSDANNTTSGTGPYEVNSYFEEPQHYRMNSRPYQDPAPDPLLSQFICSIEQSEGMASGTLNNESGVVAIPEEQRLNKGVMGDASKLGMEESLQRIEFLTEILMSTIL